jgi:predicted anti-sigma-YlaC factor YlaD
MSHPHRTWFRRLERQCEAVRETISAELDGEVSEIEAAFARRHRAECADCE